MVAVRFFYDRAARGRNAIADILAMRYENVLQTSFEYVRQY